MRNRERCRAAAWCAFVWATLLPAPAADQVEKTLADRSRQYLIDLIRLDTSNPPGAETKLANYLKKVADAEGIPNELVGGDRARLNFIARLNGSGTERPLLLMAHSDVVPADRTQWSVDPFAAMIREGYIYGRGAQDDKSLLAAELAVLVELKRRGLAARRTVILLSEADEEADSSGIQWLIRNAYPKIEAEFAINEGGFSFDAPSGQRVLQIQTAEKIPSRVVLTIQWCIWRAPSRGSPTPINPYGSIPRREDTCGKSLSCPIIAGSDRICRSWRARVRRLRQRMRFAAAILSLTRSSARRCRPPCSPRA